MGKEPRLSPTRRDESKARAVGDVLIRSKHAEKKLRQPKKTDGDADAAVRVKRTRLAVCIFAFVVLGQEHRTRRDEYHGTDDHANLMHQEPLAVGE